MENFALASRKPLAVEHNWLKLLRNTGGYPLFAVFEKKPHPEISRSARSFCRPTVFGNSTGAVWNFRMIFLSRAFFVGKNVFLLRGVGEKKMFWPGFGKAVFGAQVGVLTPLNKLHLINLNSVSFPHIHCGQATNPKWRLGHERAGSREGGGSLLGGYAEKMDPKGFQMKPHALLVCLFGRPKSTRFFVTQFRHTHSSFQVAWLPKNVFSHI